MKEAITGIELHHLINELGFLSGSRLDSIYQPSEKEFIFQFYAGSKGKQLLKVLVGKYLHLAAEKGEMPEKPSGFCQGLRKHLEGARLIDIKQKGFERVLELEFESKQRKYRLMLELFSGGNVILCSADYRILLILEKLEVKDRTLRAGSTYIFPRKMLDANAVEAQMKEALSKPDKEVVKSLAAGLGIGGTFAEELCILTGIDKNKKQISELEIGKLHHALQNILGRNLEPVLVYDGEDPVDALPFPIEFYKNKRQEKAESFSAALEKIFAVARPVKKKQSRYESEIRKLENIMEAQSRQQQDLAKHGQELQKIGEFIYQNHQDVKEALDNAKQKKEDRRIKKMAGTKAIVEI